MKDNSPTRICVRVNNFLCLALGCHKARISGIVCGMDMTFNLVYCLSNVLFAGEGIDRAGYILQKENL